MGDDDITTVALWFLGMTAIAVVCLAVAGMVAAFA